MPGPEEDKTTWHGGAAGLFEAPSPGPSPGTNHPEEGRRTVDVRINPQAQWTGIPEAVWGYTLGGYRVLKKWLSYRDRAVLGRALRAEEVEAFSSIARRIAALLAMGAALDASYRRVAEAVEGA